MPDPTRLDHALDAAKRGFDVFRLVPGTKRPAFKEWQSEATRDEATIREWWAQRDYNIGIKTGGNLVVVDIDVKNGKPGAESFKALGLAKEEHSTFRVRTASGGWHVYYRGEGPSGVDLLGPGLDVRAEGGLVVGPGSVLTNGSGQGSYEIVNDAPIIALPETISRRLGMVRRPAAERSTVPLVELDRDDAIARATAWLCEEAPLAVEGAGGDLTTYKVAARLKDFGVSKGMAFELMDEHWNERCSPPWNYEGLEEKIGNAFSYGLVVPGADHPAAVFGDVSGVVPPSPWRWHGDAPATATRWLYHGVFPALGVALLAGPTQAGKTFVDFELARSLATGKPFFSVPPEDRGGTALLFAGTEGSGLDLRWAALGESDPLPIAATTVGNLAERGALGALLLLLRAVSQRMQDTFGVPLRLVVLETLSASGLLVKEEDNGEAARAMANLATLSRELNCLVLTTHHPPKNGAGTRGASAIPNNVDYILEIERDGRDTLRRLELTKARDAEQRQLGTFTLVKVPLGKDEKGREITSMTVSMGEPMAAPRRSENAEWFMQCVGLAMVDGTEDVEGHPAARWNAVEGYFTEVKTGSKGRIAFKVASQYALDIGAVGSAMYAGARYIWIKEIEND